MPIPTRSLSRMGRSKQEFFVGMHSLNTSFVSHLSFLFFLFLLLSFESSLFFAVHDPFPTPGVSPMFAFRRFPFSHLGPLSLWLAAASFAGAAAQDMQNGPDPNADKNMTLLLKDWAPIPMLHAAQHDVLKAKFYVIDVHNHVNEPGGFRSTPIPAAAVVKAMNEANVKKVVILTGLWGSQLQ